ncbi:MAG: hypothetical protein AAGB51_13625 [Planctomycetota bacterium]
MSARPLLACVLVATLSGCAAVPRGEPFRPVPSRGDSAVVYIYRAAGDSGGDLAVTINQRRAGRLAPGEYLYWFAPANSDVFVRVDGPASAVASVHTDAGAPSFVELKGGGLGSGVRVEIPSLREGRSEISRTGLSERRELGDVALVTVPDS